MTGEEFFAKTHVVGDCWEWRYARSKKGYGSVRVEGIRRMEAHRVSYTLVHGGIPDGLVIDHLCRNPSCVNPAHLEAVTQRENVMRGATIAAKHAAKTHCDHGHGFTPENTRVHRYSNYTKRICRACDRERQRIYKARNDAKRKHERGQ